MKKRIARIVVYFSLTCLTALVLSHPYIWQSIFGPTIKGEPLWAWQQEFREDAGADPTTHSARTVRLLKFDNEPFRWSGVFNDPEMLPVLISLADDPDERVRAHVANHLAYLPLEGDVAELYSLALDDPSQKVRQAAIRSLSEFCPWELKGLYGIDYGARAEAGLWEFKKHPNVGIRLNAERLLEKMGAAQQ